MKKHLHLALALATLFTATPHSIVRAEDGPRLTALQEAEMKLLQGTWEGVEVGREAGGKCTLTITANTLSFQGGNPGEWYKGTFELPANKDPRQLAGTIKECPAEAIIGKTAWAIYKIEDGTLTLVGNPPGSPEPPKTFNGDANSRTFTLKKAEK